MSDERPATHLDPVSAPADTEIYEPADDAGEWLDGSEELPPRPRRRLLAPLPVTLAMVLLTACGFVGGVLVEKGQTSSTSSASPASVGRLAARLAALGGGSSAGSKGVGLAAGAGAGGASGGGRGGGAATVGQVTFVRGGTLYVADAQGNTVKVTTSAASSVTKTVKASVSSIHPGETVIVTGATNASGAVSAEAIRVAGALGLGGLASLLSGAGGSGSARGGGGAGGAGAGAGVALFGNGG